MDSFVWHLGALWVRKQLRGQSCLCLGVGERKGNLVRDVVGARLVSEGDVDPDPGLPPAVVAPGVELPKVRLRREFREHDRFFQTRAHRCAYTRRVLDRDSAVADHVVEIAFLEQALTRSLGSGLAFKSSENTALVHVVNNIDCGNICMTLPHINNAKGKVFQQLMAHPEMSLREALRSVAGQETRTGACARKMLEDGSWTRVESRMRVALRNIKLVVACCIKSLPRNHPLLRPYRQFWGELRALELRLADTPDETVSPYFCVSTPFRRILMSFRPRS